MSVYHFKKKLYFENSIDSQEVVKIVQRAQGTLHPVTASDYVLYNYSTVSKPENLHHVEL